MYNCQKCQKEVVEKYGSGKFCSKSCSNSRIVSFKTKEKLSNSLKGRKGLPHPLKGKQGKIHSVESRLKISNSLKGRKSPLKGKSHSLETRLKISENQKGRVLSQETRTKISQSLKGKESPLKGKLGKIHSSETKEKLSTSLKGRKSPLKGKSITEEHKLKISKANKGKPGKYNPKSSRGKSGWYKGYWSDSSYELAYIIYNLEHNIPFERNTKSFEYINSKGEKRKYYPDFILPCGKYIEIKNFISEDVLLKATSISSIEILCKNEMQPYLKYCKEKYGKDFISLYE